MNLKIYNNVSEPNRLSKDITEIYNISGTLRDGRSTLQRPIIRIASANHSDMQQKLSQMNYAYIDEFGRYYYIDDIQILRDGLFDLILRVDVLMSFKDDINNLEALIESQSDDANLYLRSLRVPLVVQPIIQQIPIDLAFHPESPSLILATVGKLNGD